MLYAEFYEATIIETIWPLLFVSLITVLLIRYSNHIKESKLSLIIPYGFLVMMILFEHHLFINTFKLLYDQSDEVIYNLPLHLCSTSAILVILYLSFKKRLFLDLLFYQGIVGAIVTFVFPEEIKGPPFSYQYMRFFLSHSILFLTPIYYMVVEKIRPNRKSLIRSLLIIQLFAAIAVMFNQLMGTHYMYILSDNSINLYAFIPVNIALPFMNNWPFVILFGEVLVFTVYGMLYLLYNRLYKTSK